MVASVDLHKAETVAGAAVAIAPAELTIPGGQSVTYSDIWKILQRTSKLTRARFTRADSANDAVIDAEVGAGGSNLGAVVASTRVV